MSGRIRTVKPEWLDDEKLGGASDAARILSIGLVLLADDYGRGRAHPMFLASHVWSYGDPHETLTKVSGALSELSEMGFVRVYEASGQRYFEIRNWSKHQKVQHAGKPRVPEPPEEEKPNDSPAESAPNPSLMRVSGDSHETLTPDLDHDLIPPTTTTTPKAAAPPRAPRADVVEVFEHWRKEWGKTAAAKLDKKRTKKIEEALASYGLDAVKRAISGYRRSPHHMGENDTQTRYDDIELFLRDAAHIEKGISLADSPPKPQANGNGKSARLPAGTGAGFRTDLDGFDDPAPRKQVGYG